MEYFIRPEDGINKKKRHVICSTLNGHTCEFHVCCMDIMTGNIKRKRVTIIMRTDLKNKLFHKR